MRSALKREPFQETSAVGGSRQTTCVTPQTSSALSSIGTWGTRLTLLALITLLAAGVSLAEGKKHKLSKDLDALKSARNGATVDVIIQFNQTPTDAHHRKVQSKGGLLKTKLDIIKGAHYTVPVEALSAFEDDPDVAYVSPDRGLKGTLDYATAAVNAPVAWNIYGLDGSSVGVAVIDSGMHSSMNDFKNSSGNNRVVYSQDFVGSGTTDDPYGHGTHVGAIAGSSGKGSTCEDCTRRFKGVAPNVNLINLRVLDQNGKGTDSQVISAIQQAISLKNTYNIRVINLSLGRGVYEGYQQDPLCQAVEQAWNAGIVVVVAAGNNGRDNSQNTYGYGTITAPGNDPYVITVGAMKTNGTYSTIDDTIATYSSKGPTGYDHIVKPDIVAPGNRVVSDTNITATLPTNYPGNRVALKYFMNTSNTGTSVQYFTLSGTSMATPVVSGAAALLLQQNPNLTPDQVKARLMKTASKAFPASSTVTDPVTGVIYTSYYDIFTVGAGYLDIAAALASNDLAAGSAMSPSVRYDGQSGNVYLVYGTGTVWGNGVVWGDSMVWGTSVFVNGTGVVWGDSVCWGTSASSGFSVIWGTGVVWGDSSDQSSSTAQSVTVTGEN